MKNHKYRECIDACFRCAAMCHYCASSCTKEEDVKMMAACIRLDMECAAMCIAAGQLMSLGSSKVKEICRICAEICRACAQECLRHDTDHCQECAVICGECAKQCESMVV